MAYIAVWGVINGITFPFPITIAAGVGKPFPLTYITTALGGVLLGPIGGALAAAAGWFVAAALAPASFLYGLPDMIGFVANATVTTISLYKWPAKLEKTMWWVGILYPAIVIAQAYIFYVFFWFGPVAWFSEPGWQFVQLTDAWPFFAAFLITYKWHKQIIGGSDFSPKGIAKLAAIMFIIVGGGACIGYYSLNILGTTTFKLPISFVMTVVMYLRPPERLMWAIVGTAVGVPLLMALKKAGVPKPSGVVW